MTVKKTTAYLSWFGIAIFLTIITSCRQKSGMQEDNTANLEAGPGIPLILPETLENRRGEFGGIVDSAIERVKEFAKQYGWDKLAIESFMDSVVIFDSKDEFDKTLLKISGMDTTLHLPKTYSACLEQRALMAVSPEIYISNYPEGQEDNYYEKLLAHEIAHRLHIRILDGNEEAMGPVWFYEGFAIYAADQLNDSTMELLAEELWKIIQSPERGNYKNYGFIIRYFVQKTSIETLVKKAGEEDFTGWLKSLEKK